MSGAGAGAEGRHEIIGILYRNMPQRKSGAGGARERALEATREQGMAWISKMKGKPLMLRHNGTLKGRPDLINQDAVCGVIKGGFMGTDHTLYVTADIDTSMPLGNQVAELVRTKVMYNLSARTEGDDFHEASIVFDGAREGSDIVLGTASKGDIDISAGSETQASTAAAKMTTNQEQLKQQLGEQGNVDLKTVIGATLGVPPSSGAAAPAAAEKPKLALTGDSKTDEELAKLPAEQQAVIMEFFNKELKEKLKTQTEFEAHKAATKVAAKEMAAAWAEDLQRRKNGPADPQLRTRRERELVEASSFLQTETGQEIRSELQQLRDENARLAAQHQTPVAVTPSPQHLQALAIEQRMQKAMLERAALMAAAAQPPQSTSTSFTFSKSGGAPADAGYEEYKRQKAAAAAATQDPLYAQYMREKAALAAAAAAVATPAVDPAFEEFKRRQAAATAVTVDPAFEEYKRRQAAAAADPLYAQYLRETSGAAATGGPPAPPSFQQQQQQQPRDPASGKWVIEASAAGSGSGVDRSQYFVREYNIRGFSKPVLMAPVQYEELMRSEATPIVLASTTERPQTIEDTKGAPVLLNCELAMPNCPISLLEPSTIRMLRGDRSMPGMGFRLTGSDLQDAQRRKRRTHE